MESLPPTSTIDSLRRRLPVARWKRIVLYTLAGGAVLFGLAAFYVVPVLWFYLRTKPATASAPAVTAHPSAAAAGV